MTLVLQVGEYVRRTPYRFAISLGTAGLALLIAGLASHSWALNLGAAAFLGAAIGVAIPRVAWGVFVASTFFTGISIDVGGLSFRPELLAVPLLATAVWRLYPAARARIPRTVLAAALLWITLTLISSLLNAPEPVSSVWIWIQELMGFLVFVLVAKSVADKRELVALGLRVAGSVVAAFIAVYLFWPLAQSGVDPTDIRLSGFAFEPNLFAAHCLTWLAVSYYWRSGRTRWSVLYEGILVLGLILAGTRAAWIGGLVLALFAAVSFVRARGWSGRKIAIVASSVAAAALGGVVLLVSVLAPGFLARMATLFDFANGTGAYRLEIYSWALSDLSAPWRWVIGSGANSFSQFHPIDPTNNGPAYLSTVWLSMIYDAGVIGGIAFFVAIAVIWWAAARRVDAIPLVAGILICATATNNFWMAFPWVALALIVDQPSQLLSASHHDSERLKAEPKLASNSARQ